MKDYLEDIVGDEDDYYLEEQWIRTILKNAILKFEGKPYTLVTLAEIQSAMVGFLQIMTDNVIPFKAKQKLAQQIVGTIENCVLDDGSIWWRIKWEDQEEWSEW